MIVDKIQRTEEMLQDLREIADTCIEDGSTGAEKAKLLKHCSERKPKEFFQVDGSPHGEVFGGIRTQLMQGGTVRVLITPGTSRGKVLGFLEEIKRWLEETSLEEHIEYLRQEKAIQHAIEPRLSRWQKIADGEIDPQENSEEDMIATFDAVEPERDPGLKR